MKGLIYSHKLLIGTTNFKDGFDSMGHIYGDFTPTEDYKLIKKQVQEFCVATKKDFEKWYSLRFNVQIENGYFIFPVGGYEIYDYPDFPDEPMEFHIAGIHSHIYEDYFENNKQFLIAPWEKLNIEQKIDLEDELFCEIGETNTSFSALAKHAFKNDVLFAIHGHHEEPFVIANLKPGQKAKIEEVFPNENYYAEFDDFAISRMVPDNKSLLAP